MQAASLRYSVLTWSGASRRTRSIRPAARVAARPDSASGFASATSPEEILVLQPRQFLSSPDSVAVVGHSKCLAKPTGRTYETDFVHVVTFRDNKIIRFQEFFDTFAAAEAFRP